MSLRGRPPDQKVLFVYKGGGFQTSVHARDVNRTLVGNLLNDTLVDIALT